MTITMSCPRCDAVIDAADEDDLVAKVQQHVREDHGLDHIAKRRTESGAARSARRGRFAPSHANDDLSSGVSLSLAPESLRDIIQSEAASTSSFRTRRSSL